MAQSNKKFLAKIYGRNGSTLKMNIPHSQIRDLPNVSDRINGGMGECVLKYAVPFDNFSEGVNLDHGYVMELWVFDDANGSGRRYFRGAIQEYEPYIAGSEQGVLVKALGLGSNLSFDMYMAAARTNYTVSHAAVDPQVIFKAIIDEYRAYATNPLVNYSGSSTQSLGTNVTKDFTDRTWFDACQDTRDLCGTDWWWHVDADGIASLLPKPSSVSHRFIIGKHIQSGNFPKSVKGVKNRIRITRTGGTVSHYSDATSITAYESRLLTINESTIGNSATADQRGNKELNDNKDPKVKASMVINTEYDIESIKVGQTCSVLNSNGAAAFFGTNVMIIGLQWSGNQVTLELGESITDIGLALDKFKHA